MHMQQHASLTYRVAVGGVQIVVVESPYAIRITNCDKFERLQDSRLCVTAQQLWEFLHGYDESTTDKPTPIRIPRPVNCGGIRGRIDVGLPRLLAKIAIPENRTQISVS